MMEGIGILIYYLYFVESGYKKLIGISKGGEFGFDKDKFMYDC